MLSFPALSIDRQHCILLTGLFCVHHPALNRIIKLSDIFSSLLPHAYVLSQEGKEENNYLGFIICMTWFYTLKIHLSVWLLGGFCSGIHFIAFQVELLEELNIILEELNMIS